MFTSSTPNPPKKTGVPLWIFMILLATASIQTVMLIRSLNPSPSAQDVYNSYQYPQMTPVSLPLPEEMTESSLSLWVIEAETLLHDSGGYGNTDPIFTQIRAVPPELVPSLIEDASRFYWFPTLVSQFSARQLSSVPSDLLEPLLNEGFSAEIALRELFARGETDVLERWIETTLDPWTLVPSSRSWIPYDVFFETAARIGREVSFDECTYLLNQYSGSLGDMTRYIASAHPDRLSEFIETAIVADPSVVQFDDYFRRTAFLAGSVRAFTASAEALVHDTNQNSFININLVLAVRSVSGLEPPAGEDFSDILDLARYILSLRISDIHWDPERLLFVDAAGGR